MLAQITFIPFIQEALEKGNNTGKKLWKSIQNFNKRIMYKYILFFLHFFFHKTIEIITNTVTDAIYSQSFKYSIYFR